MRVRAHTRWETECKRVPAENKSALGAGSVLEKLVSGMESKISTNTCAPKTGILKSSKFQVERQSCKHVHIFPDINNKKREGWQATSNHSVKMCQPDQ